MAPTPAETLGTSVNLLDAIKYALNLLVIPLVVAIVPSLCEIYIFRPLANMAEAYRMQLYDQVSRQGRDVATLGTVVELLKARAVRIENEGSTHALDGFLTMEIEIRRIEVDFQSGTIRHYVWGLPRRLCLLYRIPARRLELRAAIARCQTCRVAELLDEEPHAMPEQVPAAENLPPATATQGTEV